jgi:hypothetical protein
MRKPEIMRFIPSIHVGYFMTSDNICHINSRSETSAVRCLTNCSRSISISAEQR